MPSSSLTLRGASSNLLSIRSTKVGTAHRLILDGDTGTQTLDYLNVSDSDASGGQTLICYTNTEGCIDGGGTTNWFIASSDSTAPSVTARSPADNATNISLTTNLTLTFDETTRAGTGTLTIKKTADDSTVEVITVSGAQLSGNGSTSLTLDPSVVLAGDISYYIVYSANAFKDAVGNHTAPLTSTTGWNFTTRETATPTVTAFTPLDNATGVSSTANVIVNFSESVQPGTGSILMKHGGDNATVETIAASGALVSGSGTETITINPVSTLLAGNEYYVLIEPNAFRDSIGNFFDGISAPTTWNFEIAPESSSTTSSDASTGGGSGGRRGSGEGMAARIAQAQAILLARFDGRQRAAENASNAVASEDERRRMNAAQKRREAEIAKREAELETAAKRREDRIAERITEHHAEIARLNEEKAALKREFAERKEERVAEAIAAQDRRIEERRVALAREEEALKREREENKRRRDELVAERKKAKTYVAAQPAKPPTPVRGGEPAPLSPEVIGARRGILVAYVNDGPVLFADVRTDEWYAPYVSYLLEEEIATGYADEAGKPTGEFGVQNSVTYAEVLKMALEAADVSLTGLPPPRNKSAQGSWASAYVAAAESRQLSIFRTDLDVHAPATRGAVVGTILEVLNVPTDINLDLLKDQYKDLPADHPHAKAIMTATLYGLIRGDIAADGTPAGTVRPDDPINRAEVAKIIALLKQVLRK